MIPINIDDLTVLRRTLEDLASGTVRLDTPISGIDKLTFDEPLPKNEEILRKKMNEMVDTINAISTVLNATSTKFNS